MSNLAVIHAPQHHEQPYLGPAEVRRVGAHELEIRLPSGEARSARLALAFSYDPQVGDEVLVIGNEHGHYVIGVLRGRGTSRLTFPSDVELRATEGVVRVVGGKGIELEAPEVATRAGRVQVFADSLRQRLGSLYQAVSHTLSVRAGSTHTVVADTSYTQAKRATLLTQNEVNINGKSINLG